MSPRVKSALATISLVGTGTMIGGAGVLAINADKVDGFDAVGAKASAAKRAGKLVATDAKGRVPDSGKLGGFSHAKISAMSITPGGATVSGSGATMTSEGPVFLSSVSGSFNVGFVVPPDHKPNTPIHLDLLYVEDSPGACSWVAATGGLEGPDAPNDQPNVHNGGWSFPGAPAVTLPGGLGRAHKTTFTWGLANKPGMFIHFNLTRDAADPADTCSTIQFEGIQVRY